MRAQEPTGCCRGYCEGVCRESITGSPTSLPPASFLQMGWAQTTKLPQRPVLQPGNVQPQGTGSSSSYHMLPSKSTLTWAWASPAPDLQTLQNSWHLAPSPGQSSRHRRSQSVEPREYEHTWLTSHSPLRRLMGPSSCPQRVSMVSAPSLEHEQEA